MPSIPATNSGQSLPVGVSLATPTAGNTVVTTSLTQVLSDPDVAGAFVSAFPAAHFSLACQVMEHGKALFIEKPPCRSLTQLQELAARQTKTGAVVQVGLQKRSAPAVCRLNCGALHRLFMGNTD